MHKKSLNYSLRITKKAVKEIRSYIKYPNKSRLRFRINVVGGGCKGLKYKFFIDKNKNIDDILIKKKGIKIAIDPISFQYLVGSTIDFIDTLEKSQFMINNPNVSTTCQCGSSFGM
ncbi:iron-sulfur cluster insertion protein ErpA [Candidatus Riesia pediculischaeffi]|uniref:Iron-sulfur cluster insertion protein ErpA n=2 Tax=Candidatus Riesia pediculischaeffi TaxID=428411 RepID=A0A1V0HKY4_9ENTR|nr:iron-sulfur cluster insertion protein ErpA [Candidatus Riesia pediculischaeffi]ARC53371.1 iron-sulfur cluster insertion protein ErpA [Candidatus Riesia pediculischaeffi]KIE63862.1 putative iron binding protein from the HesB_IscA_SufA family [Candidatus Riesia pediculischaeffi PTSU]